MHSSYRKGENIYANLLPIIFAMPFLKILFDLLVGNYKLVTMISYPVVLVALVIINGGRMIKLRRETLIYIAYLITISFFSIVIGTGTFVQIFSSTLRFLTLAFSLNYVVKQESSWEYSKQVANCSLIYFLITVIASMIQLFPNNYLSNVLTTMGGNMISSTSLMNTRVNGAIGGTVIGYAVFIVLNSFVFILGEHLYSKKQKVIYLFGIVISMFLNYSRACFLGVAIALGGYFFLLYYPKLSMKYKILAVILLIGLICWYIFTDNTMIRYMFEVDQYRKVSNSKRIEDSILGLKQMDSFSKMIFGVSVGKNTGFSESGKVLGDGAIISYILDYGILGLVCCITFFVKTWKKIKCRLENKLKKRVIDIVFVDLILMLVINSGFFENMNIMFFSYPIYLGVSQSTKNK